MLDIVREFGRHAARTPEETLLLEDGAALGFRDTDIASDLLAHRIREAGVAPGHPVAWLGGANIWRQVFHLATLKAGAANIIPDLSYPDETLGRMLGLAGARVIVAERDCRDRAESLCLGPVVPAIDAPVLRRDAPAFAPYAWGPDDPQVISFTSGSTGAPKAAVRSYANLADIVPLVVGFVDMKPGDTVALLGNPWQTAMTAPFLVGARCACFNTPRHGTERLPEWLAENRVTSVMTYPAVFRQILRKQTPLPDLKGVMLVGESLTRADAEAFSRATAPGAVLSNVMGSMELNYFLRHTHVSGDPVDFEVMPLGREIAPDMVRVVDENWSTVPDGVEGELVKVFAHGPTEIIGDPDGAKRIRALPDGRRMYRTGDMAYRDFRGVHHSLGRRDQQVKIRGYTVRMAEVEAAIAELDDVDEAAVGAASDGHGIRRLICWHAGRATPEALRAQLAVRLPNYMIPSVWRRCDALPKTPTGKVRRAALPDPFDAPENCGGAPGRAPAWRNDTERRIADLFRSFLGDEPFGREDDFFDLGGDSLQAMALTMELEREFGVRTPFENLMLTGASVAALSASVSHPPTDDLVVLARGAGARPLVCAHTLAGNLSSYLPFAHALDGRAPVWGVRGQSGVEQSAGLTIEDMAKRAVDRLLRSGTRPRAIVGYSYGALIAREMARQIAERTGAPPPLALIDPHAPWATRARFLDRLRGGWRRHDLSGFSRKLAEYALAFLGLRGRAGHAQYFVAGRKYRPRPATDIAALLICTDDEAGAARLETWRPLLGGDLTTVRLPGDHASIMWEPTVRALVCHVENWLAEIETTVADHPEPAADRVVPAAT